MDQTTEIITLPKPKYLNYHCWTNEEKIFKQKDKIMQETRDLRISFRTALLNKLSGSVFGPFLKELNEKQCHSSALNQNKIQLLDWEFKRYTNHDLEIIKNRNNIFQEYLELLKKAVNTCDVIDLRFLEKSLDSLSLNRCFVKEVDCSLQNFQNIQFLNLCGNCIEDIFGGFLPRKLRFLELFDNFIGDLKNLVKHAPKTIMHLGLGRNRLTNEPPTTRLERFYCLADFIHRTDFTLAVASLFYQTDDVADYSGFAANMYSAIFYNKNDSNLHLLAKMKSFHSLRSLDLSDNDICNVKSVLNNLMKLSFLEAFSLEGNPCSVTPNYKHEVWTYFPKLIYLDFTKVLIKDKNATYHMDKYLLPQIKFKCYRVMGLQEPHKDIKNKQVFYIEVNFPLLIENPMEIIELTQQDTVLDQNESEEIQYDAKTRESDKSIKRGKDKKGKEKNKKLKPETFEPDKKQGKMKAYFLGENEYDKNFEKNNVWCRTERISWSKIMEFPPIFVNSPDNSLQLIRDTFRSIVPVRLIFLKTAPFLAKSKKDKGKQKKDKISKKAVTESIDSSTPVVDTEEEPTETIVKKVTVASFYCDLKSINWSDQTVDFYWADHTDIGDTALRINGSLKAIDYDVTLDPKKGRERLLKTIETGEIDGPKKEVVPTVLTCQVGFGLNRY